MKPVLHSAFLFIATAALAADPAPDKSQYNLLNPTPPQWLREMSTDRPDKTESAYTVDAGHFQIEMDLVNYSYDKHNPARDGTIVRTLGIAPVNLKVGLLNSLDVQLVLQPHTYVHTSDPAAGVSKQRGSRARGWLGGSAGDPTRHCHPRSRAAGIRDPDSLEAESGSRLCASLRPG